MGNFINQHREHLLLAALFVAILVGIALPVARYYNIIDLPPPSERRYPVRGIDVSAHQGNIDWPILADENIDFAFIKATEGSSFVDPQFGTNWQAAQTTDLIIGAYHFFSYDSAGASQGDHFIATVPILPSALPPVIDLELYGEYEKNPPPAEQVRVDLHALLDTLENHYQKRPIIYVNQATFNRYIKGYFTDYPLWVSSLLNPPRLGAGHTWQFWQYSHRGELAGYSGSQNHIDLNIYNGSYDKLLTLTTPQP